MCVCDSARARVFVRIHVCVCVCVCMRACVRARDKSLLCIPLHPNHQTDCAFKMGSSVSHFTAPLDVADNCLRLEATNQQSYHIAKKRKKKKEKEKKRRDSNPRLVEPTAYKLNALQRGQNGSQWLILLSLGFCSAYFICTQKRSLPRFVGVREKKRADCRNHLVSASLTEANNVVRSHTGKVI